MTQLLAITSSPKSKGSVSNDLVAQFVDTWRAHDPSAHVACRDVGLTPPPHLDEATIGAFFTPDDQRGSEQQAAAALSDELVEELETADVIVIGAPMHNFGLSTGLKAWIDHVVRVGKTFRYTEAGHEGLLKGKKVFVLTARGGNYSETSPTHAMDHQAPHLRTVLGFMGLDDVTFIHAQGVALGEGGVRDAEAEIAVAVAEMTRRSAA